MDDHTFRDLSSSSRSTSRRRPSTGSGSSRASSGQTQRRSSSSTTGSRSAYDTYAHSPEEIAAKKRAAARKRKQREMRRRRRAVGIGLLLLFILLIVTIVMVVRSCSAGSEPNPGTLFPGTENTASTGIGTSSDNTVNKTGSIRDGVTINGVDVSGKTVQEAKTAVEPVLQSNLDQVKLTITAQMGSYALNETITAADMGITTDLDTVLANALEGKKNQAYKTAFIVNYDQLTQCLNDINTHQSFGPTDATFEFTQGKNEKPKLVYHEGTSGYGIDVEATIGLIRDALQSGNFQAPISAQLTEVQPAVTVDDLKKQVTLLSSFTTEYRNKGTSSMTEDKKQTIINRCFNVEKATEIINGNVVQPGKTWSYNTVVGDRNEKNGWMQANAIVNGESYRLEYGGGVCQVSTTLYNALLQANIKIVSRTKHSIPADYVPYGLDATVDTGHIDFKFKNDTKYPLYIFTVHNVKKNASRWSQVTVYLYGQALPDGVTYKPRAETIEEIQPGEPIIKYDKKKDITYNVVTVNARKGYTIDVYLDKLVNGKVVESTKLYTDKYEAITEKRTVGTIEPTPTPSPVPKGTPTPAPVIDSGGDRE